MWIAKFTLQRQHMVASCIIIVYDDNLSAGLSYKWLPLETVKDDIICAKIARSLLIAHPYTPDVAVQEWESFNKIGKMA